MLVCDVSALLGGHFLFGLWLTQHYKERLTAKGENMLLSL